jgi:formate C-acetyltransferase
MQLQITCQSREELLAAYENPEKHKNLVVRVGGYSEYFYRLSDELKKKILERTYHL